MNCVQLIGNLTKDSEMRYGKGDKSSTAMVTFPIAVNEGFGDKQTTEYINIVSYNAEKLCEYLTKGTSVAIVGRIHTYHKEKDGVKYYNTVIIANSYGGIKLLGQKKTSNSEEQPPESINIEDDPFAAAENTNTFY